MVGVAINLLAFAFTRYLLKLAYGSTSSSPPTPASRAAWRATCCSGRARRW
ncbi:MAG: hypothetical protein MZW92_01950 [Comamonadaceae bacterium]|nr:hypothetical protein [Comamonadaceae bacterium]